MAAGTDFIPDALTREGLDHLFMVPGSGRFFSAGAGEASRLEPIGTAREGGASAFRNHTPSAP
jgi:hypothetical protein